MAVHAGSPEGLPTHVATLSPVRSNALLGRPTPQAKESFKSGKRTWLGSAFEVSDEDGVADAYAGLNRVSDVPGKTGPVIACDALVVLPLVISGVGPPVPKRKARRDRVGIFAAQAKHLAVDVIIAFRDRIEVGRVLGSSI